MEKKQNVPALRFQGFSGDWEKKTLGEIFNFKYGTFNNNPSNGGKYPVYGAGGIQGGYTDYNAEDSIIIGHMGDAGCVTWGEGKHFVTYNGTITTAKNNDLPIKYGYYLLSKMNLQKLCGGSSLLFLTYEMIQGMKAYVSISAMERKKVAFFLSNIDKEIDLGLKKIKNLQQFRQAMLTKLFPREGAAEPELRFRGFSGKWKSQKMKDLGSFLKGKLYSKKNIQTSGVPLILYGRLYTQYELVIDEVDTFAVPYENSVWSIGGEVIVPASGETAEDIAIASVVKRKGILLGGDLNIIRPNDTVSSVFLALSISYGHIHNELAKRAQGKSIVHIHNSDLVQLDIRLPSIEEQKAIGDFFYRLDRYISLQQKKLERMQRLKAALLEKLFV